MKKTHALTILFLGLCFVAHSQNIQLIHELRKKAAESTGAEKYHALNKLAWEYRSAYPDSTILYSKQAYALAKSLGFTKDLAESPNFIGVAYNYKGDRIKAYESYEEAMSVATQHHDSVQIAYSNNNLGRLFFEQGILSRAYEYFINAQKIFEDIGDASGQAYTYQSLARLYHSQNDNRKAENNFLKANNIRMQLGITPDITSAFVQTGRFYQDINEHEKALRYLLLADSTAGSINDEINLAEIKMYIARSYMLDGNNENAKAIGAEGLSVITHKNNVRLQPSALMTMGEIEFSSNNVADAKRYFDQALAIATRTKELNSRMEAYYNLWKVNERQKKSQLALENMNHYLTLLDSSKDLDLARQVERFQFEIEIERKERENERLVNLQQGQDAIIKQQRLQNIILIIVIAFISILGFIQWRNLKKRNEINQKLEHQNQFIQNQRQEIIDQNEKLSRHNHQLSDLNHEKDTLMGIVAHDLKSPLNRIKGLADIMEMEKGLNPPQTTYVQMIKDATRSGLDLITDLLDVHMIEENVEPNYSQIDISAFILDKVNSYSPAAESKNIHLNIQRIENEVIHSDVDYLHRILDNLLSNAIKFSHRNASVDISAWKTDNMITIAVKDQGPGFSEKDKSYLFQKFKKLSARPTAGESSNGLGLAIVKTLVDRLKGSISLVSEQGKGSQFIVNLPVSNI
ncbi:ATP-binding protein [Chryseolinea sp. T2]|uniref:tetratricopeptide repeat-containing sensor histidine kinase n=1 Tax=Chryseolinea sp. T2 TaxID=3129255 RepID=UPI003077AE6F